MNANIAIKSAIDNNSHKFLGALTAAVNGENRVHDVCKRIFIQAGILENSTKCSHQVEVKTDAQIKAQNKLIDELQDGLIKLAVENNHTEGWVRKTVCRVLVEHNIRRRQAGAGRKPSTKGQLVIDALDLDQFESKRDAANALLAAHRILLKEAKAEEAAK